jgi:5'-nucleotidase
MRILVTNDDSIHAEGLWILERAARVISEDVWVVAPETEQSGASHSLTLKQPLRARRLKDRHFAVQGTPTDCVLLGARSLITGKRPDLVLSGINHGSNIGEDVTYSGTVAAAMEGAVLGIPSIAFSQKILYDDEESWSFPPVDRVVLMIRSLLDRGIPRDSLVNVNFPALRDPKDCKGVRVVPQGRRQLEEDIHAMQDPFGEPIYWLGRRKMEKRHGAETDLSALQNGYITVTPVHFDLTHHGLLSHFEGVSDGS